MHYYTASTTPPPDPLVLTPPPPPGTKHAREQRQRYHGLDERSSSRISPLPRATCRPRRPFAVIVGVVIAARSRIRRPQSRRPPRRAACTAFGSGSIGSSRTRAEAAHVLRDDHRAGHRRRLVVGLMLPVGFLWDQANHWWAIVCFARCFLIFAVFWDVDAMD